RAFGANLRAYFEADALCGRLGGEEFCILVPHCGPAAARIHLDALRGLGAQTRYTLLPPEVPVTASFGVALTSADEPFEETLHRADMALYEAKAAGRDGYRFAPTRGRDAAAADPVRLRSVEGARSMT
ncbi:GGDEF domain-containing protein, partial [Methylobacterium trifolii]|uniref:GGDEF domain-containing protein n=1 Tax=Methylobacterium trifolii TaxID=1003092 RepID=UPI001EDD86F8